MDPFGNETTDLKESVLPKFSISSIPIWKRILAFLIIFIIWIVVIIIIIVYVYKNESEEKLEKYGEINCIFDIQNTSIVYPLLGAEFNKKNVEIIVNNSKINPDNYKFQKTGEMYVQYNLLGKEFSMDYMFKDIQNLLRVEMISDKNMSITSMISSFENCENLRYFKIEGFLTNSIKSMKKLFYNSHINEINMTDFDTKNVEDMSYMFANADFDTYNFNEKEHYINTQNVKICHICSAYVNIYTGLIYHLLIQVK